MKKIDLDKIKKKKTIKELLEFSIINLDKPAGPTSFDAIEKAKKILGVKKTSHFGTLDPMVTGVLPMAINRACRLSTWFMKKDKTYVGIMHLHEDISEKKLKEEMKKFLGKITQLPPVRSRVKRQERERQVSRFEIIEKKDKDVLFISEVEAGTYIRKLIHDLGLRIGGAHMTALRRTKAGIFSESDSGFVNLYDLEKAVDEYKKGKEESLRKILIPGEIVSKIMSVVQVKKEFLQRLHTGSPLLSSFIKEKEKIVSDNIAVFSDDKLIGVYEVRNAADVVAVPKFVFN